MRLRGRRQRPPVKFRQDGHVADVRKAESIDDVLVGLDGHPAASAPGTGDEAPDVRHTSAASLGNDGAPGATGASEIQAPERDGRQALDRSEQRGAGEALKDDGAQPTEQQVETPGFRGPLESALRHWNLALPPVILLVAAGAAIGLTRDPTYESEARISVGRVDAPVYTLDDALIANASLARSYARILGAEPVVREAARDVGLSADDARDRLTASPLTGSTLILVEAEGDSESQAVGLANAAARRLIVYIERLNRRQESTSLLNRFRRAGAALERARTRLRQLQQNPNASADALAQARVDLLTARTRAEATGLQYRNNEAGGLSTEGLLQMAVPAVDADSDKWSVLQRLMLLGLGAGLLLGLALALLRENRGLLKRSRA